MYISDYNQSFQIYNISDPSNPSSSGSVWLGDESWHLDVSGNYAYVANRYNGLKIIDISDPTSPSVTGNYDPGSGTSYDVRDVKVSGNYAYLAARGDGLQVIDISNPASPSLTYSYGSGNSYGIDIEGDFAYIADHSSDLSLIHI